MHIFSCKPHSVYTACIMLHAIHGNIPWEGHRKTFLPQHSYIFIIEDYMHCHKLLVVFELKMSCTTAQT